MDVDLKGKASMVTGRAGSLWTEFKNFAFKGNLIDLAVAVVLGKAFGDLISAIVSHVIMPIISYVDFGRSVGGYRTWMLGRIEIGAVLSELLNFTLIALAVFIVIVKLIGALMQKAAAPPEPGEPATRECPLCLMTVPYKARKCGHCTSDLPPLASAPG